MTKDQIESNLSQIKTCLEMETGDDVESKNEKLSQLIAFIGLSSEILRYTKQLVLIKQGEIVKDNIDTKLPPTILKSLMESEMWLELGLNLYAERINAGISHAITGLVTQISLYKAELSANMRESNNTFK